MRTIAAVRVAADGAQAITDQVAEETPIALVYNTRCHPVMMATPADLEDFALGFSLAEGILAGADELLDLQIGEAGDGIELQMRIPESRAAALVERRRNLVGRSGCGICGADSLATAIRPIPKLGPGLAVRVAELRAAFAAMQVGQVWNRACHGLHAAGFAHAGGTLMREDVGRHNALDKVLGARARLGLARGFVVITSRASFEMVQKAAEAGVSLLAAISAPTALAIRLADRAGITLVAFVRDQALSVYTHPQGLLQDPA